MDFDVDDPGDAFAFRRYIEHMVEGTDDSSINQNLIREIAHYHPLQSVTLVGGLLTDPTLAANNIRIEFLIKTVQRNAKGTAAPKRERINKWLNKYLGGGAVARAEDPPEDVFIGNVVCGLGNVRIFCGTWEQSDGLLQDTLAALNTLPPDSANRLLFVEAQAMLALSEEVAMRAKLSRWTKGTGTRAGELKLPDQLALNERASILRFTRDDLRRLHIMRPALTCFIHDERPNADERGLNTLERRPLLRAGDDLVLVLPTAISVAIRSHIVDDLRSREQLEHFAAHLVSVQLGEVMNEARPALKARRLTEITLPSIPSQEKFLRQELLTFDSGKYAHLIFVEDDLESYAANGPHIVRSLANEGAMLVGHITRVAHLLSARPDYSGGLTLIIVGGLGGASVAGIPKLPDEWFSATFRSHDLMFVARESDVTLLRIWKLKNTLLRLEQHSVEIPNLNGDFNLVSFWINSGQRLVPSECDIRSRALIVTPIDALAKVRHDLRSKYDAHVVESSNEESWLEVYRLRTNGLWNHEHERLIYVTRRSPWHLLEGVIETSNRPWWLVTEPPSTEFPKMRGVIRRIWDALLDWFAKVAPLAERVWSTLPEGPITVRIKFRAIPLLEERQWNTLPEGIEELIVRLSPETNCAEIVVHPYFFRLFTDAENKAERAFVRAMLLAAAKMAASEIHVATLQHMVDEVMPNTSARGFHTPNASEFRHRCESFWELEPRFIEDGDLNEQLLGLAWEIPGVTDPGVIVDRERCRKICNDAVDALWKRLKALLTRIDRSSLVVHCVLNGEAYERDAEQWRISANAILATTDDQAMSLRVVTERESQRARSSIASRILVEMAVCECPLQGGDLICESASDALQACVAAMIDFANQSDATRQGLAQSEINICPSGEIMMNREYQVDVVAPYLSGHFAEDFRSAANDYSLGYQTYTVGEGGGVSAREPLPESFLTAFTAEYEIQLQRLAEMLHFLQDDALPRDELVVITTKRTITERLLFGGFTLAEITAVLQHFALRHRQSWDSTPSGYRRADWSPWRYSRRLSLFARPFVLCSNADEGEIIYAPGFVFEAIRTAVTQMYRGFLPKEFFTSSEMRSWADAEVGKRGLEFEQKVSADFRNLKWEARSAVKMTELGATALYGNVDALAWNAESGFVAVVECKCLRFARTVGEICEQLRNFKGAQKGDLDDLGRHIRRWGWLYDNRSILSRITGISPARQLILPLLITNTLVPMQFVKTMPLDARFILQRSDLPKRLSGLMALRGDEVLIPPSVERN